MNALTGAGVAIRGGVTTGVEIWDVPVLPKDSAGAGRGKAGAENGAEVARWAGAAAANAGVGADGVVGIASTRSEECSAPSMTAW